MKFVLYKSFLLFERKNRIMMKKYDEKNLIIIMLKTAVIIKVHAQEDIIKIFWWRDNSGCVRE